MHKGTCCSRPTQLTAQPNGNYVPNIAAACPICQTHQPESPPIKSYLSPLVSPLQLLNDGFDRNHASCQHEKRHQTRYTRQSRVEPRRRLSSLWQLDGTKTPHSISVSPKQRKYSFSQASTPRDLENVQGPESVCPGNEIFALLEDDFVAFACQKDINPRQRKLFVRALLNVLCKLS